VWRVVANLFPHLRAWPRRARYVQIVGRHRDADHDHGILAAYWLSEFHESEILGDCAARCVRGARASSYVGLTITTRHLGADCRMACQSSTTFVLA
jgi:hypothetical protein